MKKFTFAVIGSGGGGGTIAWLLAKAGHSVALLEQGQDLAAHQFAQTADPADPEGFNRTPHDEYFYRWKRPDPKRRLRGDYNTFRRHPNETARPFKNGWTGSLLGGGSAIWGTWAYRALPVDFKLATTFKKLGTANSLDQWDYSVADWPIDYASMEPFYNVAESLLAVSGSAQKWKEGVLGSEWYQRFQAQPWFARAFPESQWSPQIPYPCGPYPTTPVGGIIEALMNHPGAAMKPLPLPTAIVQPGSAPFKTRAHLAAALGQLAGDDGFWARPIDQLWSERVRQACNLCGHCGEFLCWGGARPVTNEALTPGAPKSGTLSTVLEELRDLQTAGRKDIEVLVNARAYEVVYDGRKKRASGVRYLDVTNPDRPAKRELASDFVILSCGAVQSARLLWMSGPSRGLGNQSGHLGRHATFHLFGLGAKAVLKKDLPNVQGLLHGEFGHTGNVTSFAPYFLQEETGDKLWLKAGTLTSTAKKNPLENAFEKAETLFGSALGDKMKEYNRTLEVRLTADDLPRPANRVDLDPRHVDEFGFPVARITRDVGPHEWRMFAEAEKKLVKLFEPLKDKLDSPVRPTPHIPDLIGDHQMGTCRMGDNPKNSVIDAWCRVHEAKNVFVVDSSFMPTGLGLNPMVTVVANALRVGTFIANTLAKGGDPSSPRI